MPKYHISPKTNKPNICKATVACPIGGAHFNDKQEALDHIEHEAVIGQDVMPVGVKKDAAPAPVEDRAAKAQAMFNALSPEDQAELLDMLAERREARAARREVQDAYRTVFSTGLRKLIYEDSCKEELIETVKGFAETYKPGCSGCRDGYRSGNYCNCSKYHDRPQNMTASKMALALVNSNLDYSSGYLYDEADANEDQRKVLQDLTMLISRHNLDRAELYDVDSRSDYYGEYLEDVKPVSESFPQFKEFHRELTATFD